MTTYRNVTSTVTHVMEFTEECLTVFWTYVHALLCAWHLDQDDKITLILYTICMLADMKQPSQRIVSYLTLPFFKKKTIINLQKCRVHSCHHRHKGSHIGEQHCLLLHPRGQPYRTRSREDFYACGMVVHSGLYIPVSSRIHPSLLDLVIIFPI